MRYRITDYVVNVSSTQLAFNIDPPAEVMSKITTGTGGVLTDASRKYVTDSIRLIADEDNGGLTIVSTGQKDMFAEIIKFNDTTIAFSITKATLIAVADGDEDDLDAIDDIFATTGSRTSGFTIEFDWGDTPFDGAGGGGELEPATNAEYAAFKTHMQTEIANILTTITEE